MSEPRRIISFRFPFVLKAAAGGNFRGQTRWKSSATKRQRGAMRLAWASALRVEGGPPPQLPLVVHLTRVAPVHLDDDNLVSAFKAMRDQLAQELGFNDRSRHCIWLCHQLRGEPARRANRKTGTAGRPGEYAVQVVVMVPTCLACQKPLDTAQRLVRIGVTGFVHALTCWKGPSAIEAVVPRVPFDGEVLEPVGDHRTVPRPRETPRKSG